MTWAVRRRSISRLAIAPAFLIACGAEPVSAATQEFYLKKISEFRSVIDAWNRGAEAQLVLTVAVIIIGAVVAALQSVGRPWARPVTIALGICTTVFTAISAKVVSADYRTFEQAVIEGEGLLDQLEEAEQGLSSSPSPPADLRIAWDKTVNQFRGLQERVLRGTSVSGSENAWVQPLVGIVHAQNERPDWITTLPQDNLNYYFSGTGRGTSITSAESEALQAAIDSAYDTLNPSMVPRSSFASYLGKVASVDKRWFILNKQDGQYDYALLLRLGRDIKDSLRDLRTVALQFQKSGWRPLDLATSDKGQIFVLDGDNSISQVFQSGSQLNLQLLFRIPVEYEVASVTANNSSVLVSANAVAGCVVFKYDLNTKVTAQKYLGLNGRCTGIAYVGADYYVVLAQAKKLAVVKSGSTLSPDFTELLSLGMPGTLLADEAQNRLLVSDRVGAIFAVDLRSKKTGKFASNVGWVNELAATKNYVFAASGNKILTLLRSTGKGRSSPGSLAGLPGGNISGIATHDGQLWLIDSDNGILKGPIPVD